MLPRPHVRRVASTTKNRLFEHAREGGERLEVFADPRHHDQKKHDQRRHDGETAHRCTSSVRIAELQAGKHEK